MNLGENIYRCRSQRNMSQGDLADALEVSRQSVSKWENNSAVPELDKLIKMAQLFDITLDEMVTGEEKKVAVPTPPPAPSPTTTTKEGFTGWKIVGTILLTCGLLLSIVCLIVSILKENQYGNGMRMAFLLVGLPMIVIGIVCLLVKKHTGLVCGWVLFLPLWIASFFLSTSAPLDTVQGIIMLFIYVCGIALSIGTLVQLWTGKIQVSLVTRIILTVLIALAFLVTLMGLQPPQVKHPTELQPNHSINS